MRKIKEAGRAALRRFGLEINRLRPEESSPVNALGLFGIDLVLDIGANTGQFGRLLRRRGFVGRIVSFEPLRDAHERLSASAAEDPLWEVAPRCAIGSRPGETMINVSGNSQSSSILPMLDLHSRSAPTSAYVDTQKVDVQTLDLAAINYLRGTTAPLIKIDTQGYEWHVLDGGEHTLSMAKGILIELSLAPLYEGQHLWQDVIARLDGLGFSLWSLSPVFSDPANGRTLQLDGLFFRTDDQGF